MSQTPRGVQAKSPGLVEGRGPIGEVGSRSGGIADFARSDVFIVHHHITTSHSIVILRTVGRTLGFVATIGGILATVRLFAGS